MSPHAEGPSASFVDIRCLCGKLHTFMRSEVVEGLGTARWKCGGCKRRFVVACTPEDDRSRETFWPIYLEDVPVSGVTRQEGVSTDDAPLSPIPAELHFQCRCGCKLVGKPSMYGRPTRCPRCGTRTVLRVGYASEDGRPVPLLEYPEDPAKAPS
jgi:hypothetical protein